MAKIIEGVSRTFSEFLLIPRLTRKAQTPELIDLSAPVGSDSSATGLRFRINVPIVSAAMQSVTDSNLAIALARQGGLGFIFGSQDIGSQAAMVRQVKSHKAGFVSSDTNTKVGETLRDVIGLMKKTGHSTVPVTSDGTSQGRLLGIITDQDFWQHEDDLNSPVESYMTKIENVIFGEEGLSLKEANSLLHMHKKNCLPVIDKEGNLKSLVFKKDYEDHMRHPNELLDSSKRLCVGAALNTRDYQERAPKLVEAGVDVLCFDSSDGLSEYQKEGLDWVRNRFGQDVVLGGGNIVSKEGFDYLVSGLGVDFVKVGIGGGSICITREQKGVGRGQASALLDVVARRDEHFKNTGIYVPICSDGGLSNDTQIVLALAMGADFVMMGRYFAMTDESPSAKTSINGQIYKSYWGEGTRRAQNWQRYSDSVDSGELLFEEGVDAYVPYVGGLSEVLATTLKKIKSTMINLGADDLIELKDNAVLTLVSEQSIVEAGTSSVFQFTRNSELEASTWGENR
ncbi:MAG: inosine 5-monophosphate dehydrogenase [Gammaproteobacteria bacterium]|nr:inosine 5-monophosphate dehydrogenase [Gammaproteobacteria bacterium]